MKLTIYHEPSAFAALATEWRALVAVSTCRTPFQLPDFQEIWWRHFGSGQLQLLTWRTAAGELCGLASFFVDASQTLRWVGGEDIADYLDVVARAADLPEIQKQVFAWLLANPDWQLARLPNMPAWSSTAACWLALAEAQGWQTTYTQLNVCPRLALPTNFEVYLDSLEGRQRHEIRRKLRRTAAADSEISWRIVQGVADPSADVALFLDLLAQSQPEKAAFLTRPNMRAAFTELLTALTQSGLMQLAFLAYQSQAVAAYCSFDYAETIWLYNSGLQAGVAAAFSPGWVLLARIIEYAIAHNYQVFDFLQGDEDYKYRFGGQDVAVWSLTFKR